MTILEKTFAELERAAIAGKRCPMNSPFGPLDSASVGQLCRDGRIVCHISGRNYRTITILTGPNAGKRTAPNDKKPWKTVGTATYEHHVEVDRVKRPGPSAPRRIGR